MKEAVIGNIEGKDIKQYTITNANNMSVTLISFGARIKDLFIPDRENNLADVSLGYDDLAGYMADACYFGATIGRVANRISHARFSMNGKEYPLYKNDGAHHLHGGKIGFDKRIWQSQAKANEVIFTYTSPAGEEGYPGEVKLSVTYKLDDNNELSISYSAISNEDTPLCLTNHCYFNLSGAGDVLNHELKLNASYYCPSDDECLPLGELATVGGTPMDFTSFKRLGEDISADFEQIKQFGGYDHNYVLDSNDAAILYDKNSGRRMYVTTDMPCIQLYTANSTKAKGKGEYGKHCSVCFETQFAPDIINSDKKNDVILKAGERFFSVTSYRFEWE